jgi:hypothetical protein
MLFPECMRIGVPADGHPDSFRLRRRHGGYLAAASSSRSFFTDSMSRGTSCCGTSW